MATHISSRIARRKKRVSANIEGTQEKPRVAIFRSNKYIYAQAINDLKHETIVAANSLMLAKEEGKKSEISKQVGMKLAELLKDKKISTVVFDRSQYSYNGRVKALAEGLREGGIQV
jgi:large subunit ribosomal protein L18